METKYTITREDARLRLDIFLAQQFPQFSRSKLKKAIVAGNIFVNGEACTRPHYKLVVDDVVELRTELHEDPRPDLDATEMDLDIVYEDRDILVLNKSAGVVVHPGAAQPTGTLAGGVKFYLRAKNENAWEGERYGLVHRLDKATTGIIVFAKNEESLAWLSQQFAERRVEKYYLALVRGEFKHEKLRVDMPLGRSEKNRQKISSRTRKPKTALTEFFPIQGATTEDYSLVLAKPYTGRTHQIRVHLSENDYPIIGDEKYGVERDFRLMLHAFALKIRLTPNSPAMLFFAQPGADFLQVLSIKKINIDILSLENYLLSKIQAHEEVIAKNNSAAKT